MRNMSLGEHHVCSAEAYAPQNGYYVFVEGFYQSEVVLSEKPLHLRALVIRHVHEHAYV